jgi:hypothetical protein
MLDPANIFRSKRKSLALYIDPNGVLIVKSPLKLPDAKIYEFVKSKEAWIRTRQKQIAQNSYISKNVVSYNTFLYLGRELTPVLCNKAKEISLTTDAIIIPAKWGSNEILLRRVEKFLKITATNILTQRAQYFQTRLNLIAASIATNNNKTRWGVCDTKRRIQLNWRAVMLPPNLFDYIIVHEYCHLLEFNHTKNFWRLVEAILPDWRTLRKHLKQMGWLLQLFRN